MKLEPAAGVTVRAPEAVVIDGVTIEVPNVPVVPILSAFAAEIPPEVLIAPVTELVVSRVDGAKSDALAPVPPIVRSVVAPAKAVKEVDGVVILVLMAGEVMVWTPVNVCAASVRAIVALVVGKVIVVLSVPVMVIELLAVRVLPLAMVKVALVAGAVIATLLIEVAEATPRFGVVKTGEVKVLLVSVCVPPTVTTEAAFVPAVVTRKSPVPTVRIPVE